jgi:hypothetical protein
MDVVTKKFTDRRQLDIPLTTQYHFITPTDVRGRLTTEDYIFFIPLCPINFNEYDVLIESFNGDFKKLGGLDSVVRLPHVHFVDNALLLVVHKFDGSKPKFVGTVERGKKYSISLNHYSNHSFYLLQ